jgi:ferrous iron transport protein B
MDRNNKLSSYVIALAGNANVGKSALFNQLTGLHQTIGNWPGKTVEIKEGHLLHQGLDLRIVDLPGIYSLSSYSPEEEVTESFILENKPDLVINVVDAAHLERNLYLTILLMEMEIPMILCLNQIDFAQHEGISIDTFKLSKALGIPVVPTVAIHGKGLDELIQTSLDRIKDPIAPKAVLFGDEIENTIQSVIENLKTLNLNASSRFYALRLLENKHHDIVPLDLAIQTELDISRKKIEDLHREPIEYVLSSERYSKAEHIARESTQIKKANNKARILFDMFLLSPISGYFALTVFLLFIFSSIFYLGNFIASWLEIGVTFLEGLVLSSSVPYASEIWSYGIVGVLSAVEVVLPYILPFYLLLSFFEDSGYIARMAVLTDSVMHLAGLHGKAFLPLFLGYGCTVTSILGSRIIEDRKERIVTCLLSTLVPCSARTIIIMGLIGAFIGFQWVLLVYALNMIILLLVGRLSTRFLKSTAPGLIIEVPTLRWPNIRNVFKSTWFRLKDFFVFVVPIILIGHIFFELIKNGAFINNIEKAFSGVFRFFWDLPSFTVIPLIFGILRKELGLIMLQTFSPTGTIAGALSPRQMIVYSLIMMFYFPCVATLSALVKELGWKKSLAITAFDITFALLIGIIVNLGLSLFLI